MRDKTQQVMRDRLHAINREIDGITASIDGAQVARTNLRAERDEIKAIFRDEGVSEEVNPQPEPEPEALTTDEEPEAEKEA